METTLARTRKWFKKYQPHLSQDEWQELYKKLILEELGETMDALKQNDLVEFLDGCIDLYWVIQGYQFFWWKENIKINPFQLMFDYIHFDGDGLTQDTMIYDLITAVADSNFTKSYELQDEWQKIWKVIKWDNFIAPTQQIEKIISLYNIRFI